MARDDALLWMARPPVVLLAAGGVWTAAAWMHAQGVSWHDPAIGTALAVAAVSIGKHRPGLAFGLLAAGTWVTAAAAYGALAGPYALMTITWGTAALAALWKARRHPAVAAARKARAARMEWLRKAGRYRLHGSH